MPRFIVKLNDEGAVTAKSKVFTPNTNIKRFIKGVMSRNGLTVYDLAQRLNGKVAERALYRWFKEPEATINSRAIEWMMDVLEIYPMCNANDLKLKFLKLKGQRRGGYMAE
ncbi:MAG TPA: hypothetical protein VK324_00130 [Tepidisphaeraceae bacterium]|nr:hypothetical protein [Tepidisphaeraceae bacterium]